MRSTPVNTPVVNTQNSVAQDKRAAAVLALDTLKPALWCFILKWIGNSLLSGWSVPAPAGCFLVWLATSNMVGGGGRGRMFQTIRNVGNLDRPSAVSLQLKWDSPAWPLSCALGLMNGFRLMDGLKSLINNTKRGIGERFRPGDAMSVGAIGPAMCCDETIRLI